jgi:hypothetical protein
MEETVWVYYSVIAIFIVFGIVITLVSQNTEETKNQYFLGALDELQSQCNYVCNSGVGTNLPVDVTFPAGLYFYTRSNKLCGTFQEKNHCNLCDCDLEPYALNLSTEFALKALKTHEYACYFERKKDGVSIECQG